MFPAGLLERIGVERPKVAKPGLAVVNGRYELRRAVSDVVALGAVVVAVVLLLLLLRPGPPEHKVVKTAAPL